MTSSEVIGIQRFLAQGGLQPRELDILDGSPPCAQFSTAGRGVSDQDVLRAYSDVKQKNIATLPFDFVELALIAQPKIVIMENVPGLAQKKTREILNRVLQKLRYSYYAHWRILSASDYGVPQARRRLFVIGVRRDVGNLVGIDTDEKVFGLFPSPTRAGGSIRLALAGLHQTKEQLFPWHRSVMGGRLGRLIRLLPKNPTKHTRLAHLGAGHASNFSLTRCAWDLPAPTLTVTGQQPNGMSGAIHPEEDRKFTLPELKRLFALPDDFVLTGTLAQAAERICRMVPPLLTKAIAESVHRHALRPYEEARK